MYLSLNSPRTELNNEPGRKDDQLVYERTGTATKVWRITTATTTTTHNPNLTTITIPLNPTTTITTTPPPPTTTTPNPTTLTTTTPNLTTTATGPTCCFKSYIVLINSKTKKQTLRSTFLRST